MKISIVDRENVDFNENNGFFEILRLQKSDLILPFLFCFYVERYNVFETI